MSTRGLLRKVQHNLIPKTVKAQGQVCRSCGDGNGRWGSTTGGCASCCEDGSLKLAASDKTSTRSKGVERCGSLSERDEAKCVCGRDRDG